MSVVIIISIVCESDHFSLNCREKSQSEILGRIEELQIANKKLIEEKEKLRAQVSICL